jgi:hypothetical protein
MLTNDQRKMLLTPLKPNRVNEKQGMKYLEAFDVIAHLTRAFGFEGWSKEILTLELIFESEGKSRDGSKATWTVAYRCAMRLVVRDPDGLVIKETDDASTGEAINQPSRGDAHDLAMKSAVSGALKRCAKDLGDQFGLGLYDGGSTDACVKRVVIYDNADQGPGVATRRPSAQEDGGGLPDGGGAVAERSDSPANRVASGQHSPSSEISGLAEEAVTASKVAPPRDPASPERSSAVPGADESMMTNRQSRHIFAIINAHTLGDRHLLATQILQRPVASFKSITSIEADKMIEALNQMAADSVAAQTADSR